MMREGEKLRLGAFFNPTGHHVASWRHPQADADANVNFQHYADIARLAETGKFDLIFLADNISVRTGHPEVIKRSAQYIAGFEPLTLLSALSAVTKNIGLVATASTSFNEPYHVARKFASLDHLSNGRAGWNIVTSGFEDEARNFNRDHHFGHAERYDRAHEFCRVVQGLWDSWEDEAFVRDRKSGVYFDPTQLHALNHKGKHFQVAGPLNVPRSPQGYPVMVQAGASADGLELGAAFAEVIFTNHFDIESAKTYYRQIRDRAASIGRDPAQVKVLPGLSVIVAPTAAEAEEKFEHLQSMVDPLVARELLSLVLGGADLSSVPFDGPLPSDLKPTLTNGTVSGFNNWVGLAKRENLTVRQLAYRAISARGKSVVKGSPADVADYMQNWFESHACDGFNIMPPYLPGGLKDFVDLVVPELQRRGLFRREYEGATLRENLGLRRPPNRHTEKPVSVAV
jgi:alkanesulfonate monooxygenase